MDPLSKVAEARIREALEAGELERFAGKGEPLPPEDDLAHVPEDLRAGYRLLKGHGFLPDEVATRRGITEIDLLLAATSSAEQRTALEEQRRRLALKMSLLLEGRGVSVETIDALVRRRLE
jgi:hypothetical protein